MKRTILITGSSAGIGKATAKLFHDNGWNVVATMRAPEKEEELKKLEDILVTRLDVLDLSSIKAAVKQGIEKFGKIDVVVNNAGYGAYGPLESFPRENVLRQFNTNVIGLLDVTREIIPHFRKNKNGIIINISSVGGKITFPFGSLYHGTKFAVEGFSESLNFEMEKIGCRVKIVEPGSIRTDFAGRSFDFSNDKSLTEYQDTIDKMLKGIDDLLHRASAPELVAGVIYEAATDGANKLRYTAGEDAKEILAARKNIGDEEFSKNIKARFAV